MNEIAKYVATSCLVTPGAATQKSCRKDMEKSVQGRLQVQRQHKTRVALYCVAPSIFFSCT